MEAMQESLVKLQQLFTDRMEEYQSKLEAATPSANITTLSADFSTFKSFVMFSLSSLQEQLSLVSQQLDGMEMRSRRKILLFHGVPEEANEDCTAVIANSITNQLKLPAFSPSDITRCHRMGRVKKSDRPRPILLELCDLQVRSKIWQTKTAYKGTGVTVSEFLTKPRHEAFMAAREKFGITKSYTKMGVVCVVGPDDKRYHITSVTELSRIPNKPLTSHNSPQPKPAAAVKERAGSKTRRAAAATANKK